MAQICINSICVFIKIQPPQLRVRNYDPVLIRSQLCGLQIHCHPTSVLSHHSKYRSCAMFDEVTACLGGSCDHYCPIRSVLNFKEGHVCVRLPRLTGLSSSHTLLRWLLLGQMCSGLKVTSWPLVVNNDCRQASILYTCALTFNHTDTEFITLRKKNCFCLLDSRE